MSRAFGERFGWELEEVLPEWYTRDRVARCIVKFGPLFQVRNDDDTRRRTRVEFAVWNEGEVEALVNVRCENRVFDGADVVEEQVVRVAPGSGKRVAMMFGELQSVELNTGISSNLPSIFSDRIQGSFTEDTVRGEWEVGKEYFLPDEGVYLTDNRDAGCRVKESARRWLESLTGGEGERYWNLKSPLMVPNERWWEYLSAGAEGMAIRSFLYRGAGTGGSSVEWETELPEDGRYEVFVFIPNDAPANFLLGEKGRIQEYTVCPRGEKEERMDVPLKWGDWTSLGVYDCEKGVSRVVLSDRGVKGQCITADAVKWVRVED